MNILEIEEYLGNMKYSGESVVDGVFDANKSAQALLGFDQIVRFFLIQEEPLLSQVKINLPVKINKGSWEVLIPELIEKYVTIHSTFYTIVSVGGLAYIKSIAETAGKDGLLETGPAKDIKTIFKNAFIAIQRIIKITKHLGGFEKEELKTMPIVTDNKSYVKITNNNEINMLVPKQYFDTYLKCPTDIFNMNAELIEKDRELSFGTLQNHQPIVETISFQEKDKFIEDLESSVEDMFFPELEHGKYVELEGEINRISEKYNNLGFWYKGHSMVIRPKKGSLLDFKSKIISQSSKELFQRVKILGIVDRLDANGNNKSKKPEILFEEVIPLVGVIEGRLF